MVGEQVFIGLTTSGLCAVGLAREAWFLCETKKGRRLVDLCGPRNALWLLRCLFALGVLFGLALASGLVNPIRWTATTATPHRHLASEIRCPWRALQC